MLVKMIEFCENKCQFDRKKGPINTDLSIHLFVSQLVRYESTLNCKVLLLGN